MEQVPVPLEEILLPEGELTQDQKDTVVLMAESLKVYGQFHPIIVYPKGEDGKYKIGTGRKRVLAAREAGFVVVQAVIADIEVTKMEEMVLHENLRRTHLEWWERAALIKAFHDNQVLQKDTRENKDSKPKTGEKSWGMRDTARELGISLGAVSEDLNLANYVANNPRFKNVTDRRTAMMLINQEKKRVDAEIDAMAPPMPGVDSTHPRLNEVYFGDSIQLLKSFPDGFFDACVTDPPWLKFRGVKELEKDESTHLVFREVFRVLKVNSFLYMFLGLDDVIFYRDYLANNGFKVSKTPCLWLKEGAMSAVGVSAWEYGRNYEFILVAVKGTPVLAEKTQKSATFKYRVVHGRTAIHPHEKPVDLLAELLEDCSYEGNKIVDPFGGSGALGEAAWKKKREFVVIERDRSSFEQIKTRFEEMRKEKRES